MPSPFAAITCLSIVELTRPFESTMCWCPAQCVDVLHRVFVSSGLKRLNFSSILILIWLPICTTSQHFSCTIMLFCETATANSSAVSKNAVPGWAHKLTTTAAHGYKSHIFSDWHNYIDCLYNTKEALLGCKSISKKDTNRTSKRFRQCWRYVCLCQCGRFEIAAPHKSDSVLLSCRTAEKHSQ